MKREPEADEAYRPQLYDAADPATQVALRELRAAGELVQVSDRLEDQIRELVQAREPALELTTAQLDVHVRAYLGERAISRHGTWAYYPWSMRLVHVLAEDELRFVRLSRNRHKITEVEQDILATRRVGVVGLSVGQASAMTLAMEGVAGTLRLADLDHVSLSNLNRMRAGVHEIGVNKAVVTARAITEIDPYARVEVFPGGIEDANMDAFLDGIDLLVEQCDDLYVKLALRERARTAGVPVLMETCDRGMLDVERYDREPDRPILHGLAGNLATESLRGMDHLDQVPILHRLLGETTISPRLAASMLEVRSTLRTWPQLASAAALGGAVITDVARRILLGEMDASGRFYVDLEQLVRPGAEHIGDGFGIDATQPDALRPDVAVPEVTDAAETAPLFLYSNQGGARPTDEIIRVLVGAATLAPSAGNRQPWRWAWNGKRLRAVHDLERSRGFLDVQHRATYLAFGAAVENLVLAAGEMALHVDVTPFPEIADASVVCDLRFAPWRPGDGPTDRRAAGLAAVIRQRFTNRRLGPRVPMGLDDAAELAGLAEASGAHLELLTEPEPLGWAGELIGRGERLRFVTRALHRELTDELRWSRTDAERTRDGVEVAALELTAADLATLRLASAWPALDLLARLGGGRALERPGRRAVAAASAVGLLSVPHARPEDFLAGGRVMERVWLEANARGYAFQPMTTLLPLFARLADGAAGLSAGERLELEELRRLHERLFTRRAPGELMLFRLARTGAPTTRSLRRKVEDVLTLA
jgi:molybdopterin/thiamine biosynthesis adenylyltransferase/nitroreductase